MGLLKRVFKEALKPAKKKAKGIIGEKKVSRKLNSMSHEEGQNRKIDNLMIVDQNGKSHQIDHIEIRQNGIFCIETKNYAGWIFGSESQESWIQVFYKKKYKFPNPIKQNSSHIYYLRKILGERYKINSIIVFVQNNADRINIPQVINLEDLNSYLSNFYDGTQYTVQEIETIYKMLLSASRKDVTQRQHIENIKKTRNDLKQNICPRCGGDLKLKHGIYGDFYGCVKYPMCKFTKKLEK